MNDTLSQMFLHFTSSFPKDHLFLHKIKGRYVPVSTAEFAGRVKSLALGLKVLGIKPGDKIVLLAENGPDWVTADYAALCLGAVTVPIYTSLVPEQVKYIIQDSDAKAVITSNRSLREKVEAVKSDLPKVDFWLSFEEEPGQGTQTIRNILEKGRSLDAENPGLFERLARSVRPDDLASIIYTSGTTGVPKGVMLSHANFVSNIKTLASIVAFDEKDTVLSFLPLSHVLERMVTFSFLFKGCTIAYAESVETVAENLIEVRPTIMVSVPRLFEKIYAKVMDNVLAGSKLKKKIFFWALRTGGSYREKLFKHQPIKASLRRKQSLARRLVFSKILDKTGGKVRFFVSGGAPLSGDIAEFFFSLGLLILEGYGLTESSPVISVNTFENLKFGTVGKPIPGVEVKIAADGEILARGPNVMRGYYKLEKETQETLEGGWLRTGDIGHLDEDGYLVITDRKKDLIVTSGGKNVAPQPIENLLKQNPYIANAVVVGGRRKFIAALLVPNFGKLEEYARFHHISYDKPQDLAKNSSIVKFLLEEVDRTTPYLAPYEKVKKIALLDRDFELERGEITPTLKVKRKIIEEKYKDIIDALYRE